MQTPNSLGIGDGKAPGFFVVVGLAADNVISHQALGTGYTYELSPILACHLILLYNDKRIRPMGIIKKWSFL